MTKMTNSTIVANHEIPVAIVGKLVDQMGELPTKHFDLTIIVTVVVTPLPDEVEVVQLSRPHHT